MADIPESLLPFGACPAKALSISTRMWLSKRLNPELDSLSHSRSLVQDWRGVAEFLEFPSVDIDNFARDKSPTNELLRQWVFLETSTIGKLLEAIDAVERYDILAEEQLALILERDCAAHQKSVEAQMKEASRGETSPIQVDEVTSVDESKYITVNEVVTGAPEYFDAFVCYTHQDFEFVRQMMHKLETMHDLKLCIVSRDLMPGCAEYVIMAKLIQERCRKMIIVLSPDYINSKECEFQTRFAHSLAPGAKEKKLIPVIYRPCAVPSILNHICTVDYTRCDVVEWFWDRLANSLKSAQRDALTTDYHHLTAATTTDHRLTASTSTHRFGSPTSVNSAAPRQAENPRLDHRCSAISAPDTEEVSRTPSANSLADTSSNNSWTDLSPQSVFQQEDQMRTSRKAPPNPSSLVESVEMLPVENPTNPRKIKLLNKIMNTFKKH